MGEKRKYLSIYFGNGLAGDRKKRDVTVVFREGDPLYEKCHKLGSSHIKRLIGVSSYGDLLKSAKGEDRTISNFIKFRIKKALGING